MTSDLQSKRYIVHPQKFALWLFILTVVMVFAGLTSAYIVHRGSLGEGERLVFDLPKVLWNNLALILFSSVTMQFSLWSLKREERTRALVGLGMTLVLGILFLFGQWAAFEAMVESKLFFVDNERIDDSVSFFYIITGLHGVHIVAGLIVLLSSLILIITERLGQRRDVLTLEMASIFWHFLGLLWVYLFVFLKYTQN